MKEYGVPLGLRIKLRKHMQERAARQEINDQEANQANNQMKIINPH